MMSDEAIDKPFDDSGYGEGGVINLTQEDIEELTYQKRVEEAEQGEERVCLSEIDNPDNLQGLN